MRRLTLKLNSINICVCLITTCSQGGQPINSPLALPFRQSWQYLTDAAEALPPLLDAERVYLPLADGRIICLERSSGALLWSSQLGGRISAPLAAEGSVLYVASRRADQTEGSLRSLDKATGLTLWARDYDSHFTSRLEPSSGRIYAGSADGAFYALSAKDGQVIWKLQTQDRVRGAPLLIGRTIYFGSDDGALRSVEADSGRLVWKFQTSGPIVGRPAADSKAIYFGSGDGFAYSVDLLSGKLRWRWRTGAAIEASPALAGDRLIIASFDNFVYALSPSNGNLIWKHRLESRVVADPMVISDATLVAPFRGNRIVVLLNSDGRQINSYKLEPDREIASSPAFLGGSLAIPTDKGLLMVVAVRADTRALMKSRRSARQEALSRAPARRRHCGDVSSCLGGPQLERGLRGLQTLEGHPSPK
jgi:outer membrane protein assembly factor BamB